MAISLQHPSDPKHALILRELSDNCSFPCPICRLRLSGPTYCCGDCDIFLHKFCTELPLETRHPDHPHLLALSTTREELSHCPDRDCDIGGSRSTLYSYVYRCKACLFSVDLTWKFLIPYTPEEEDEEEKGMIEHIAHEHPLTPFRFNQPIKVECRACELKISGPLYGCSVCSFYLHESCARLPTEISQHPFHPQHPLTVFLGRSFNCSACNTPPLACRSDFGFAYKCKNCPVNIFPPAYNLDAGCATLFLPSKDQQAECRTIEHFSHHHRLRSISVKEKNTGIRCKACDLKIKGEVYGCPDCIFFLHRSCADELPQEMVHYLHPEHPLIFQAKTQHDNNLAFSCDSCGTICVSPTAAFSCEECRFNLDLACAFSTFSAFKEGVATQIQPCYSDIERLNPRPESMILFYFRSHKNCLCIDDRSKKNVGCHGCHEPVLGLAYCTTRNDLYKKFICKSCAKLPEELKYPFHPSHPLTLQLQTDLYCDAVGIKIEGLCFGCNECQFFLSLGAASSKLALKYQPHEHSLIHFERIHGRKFCNFCGKRSSVDSYRCVQCDYSVHYNCIRKLPLSAKHDFDSHPLFLQDKLVKESHDEQYCDACEKTRRPDRGVYYCAECNFAAHIGCVIPWVDTEETAPAELKKLDREIAELETDIERTKIVIEVMLTTQKVARKRIEKLKTKRHDLALFLA